MELKTNKKFDGIVTFGIDCDGVLRDLLLSMVSLYNEKFNDNMSLDDVKDFNVDVSFPRISELTGVTASKWFFQDNGYELFSKSPSFPKTKKAIETLQKYGQVIIVTYQKSYDNRLDTLKWLNRNGIVPDGICFIKNKTLLHLTWFIDDNYWNFFGCNAEHGVLIDAPHNRDIDETELLKASNCQEITRYDSLYDFAKDYDKKQQVEQTI